MKNLLSTPSRLIPQPLKIRASSAAMVDGGSHDGSHDGSRENGAARARYKGIENAVYEFPGRIGNSPRRSPWPSTPARVSRCIARLIHSLALPVTAALSFVARYSPLQVVHLSRPGTNGPKAGGGLTHGRALIYAPVPSVRFARADRVFLLLTDSVKAADALYQATGHPTYAILKAWPWRERPYQSVSLFPKVELVSPEHVMVTFLLDPGKPVSTDKQAWLDVFANYSGCERPKYVHFWNEEEQRAISARDFLKAGGELETFLIDVLVGEEKGVPVRPNDSH